MRIDMTRKLLTLRGKESDPPAWPTPLTLEECCYTALRTGIAQDQDAPLSKKLELYKLAAKVTAGGIVDLTAAEITLLQERIGKVFICSEVVGVAYTMLEPQPATVRELVSEGRTAEAADQAAGK